jgi:hypothetical protein
MMQGITMKRLYELVSYRHDVEFVYHKTTYVLQPEMNEANLYLVIWDCSSDAKCIAKHEIPLVGDIPKEMIDAILREKCFDGKSFLEIERNVTVTVIY